MIFKIMAGDTSHPYLSVEERQIIRKLPDHSQGIKAAGLIFDAPGVMWPKGVRQSYSKDLVAVVEGLLSRDRSRAGLKEVRDDE